MRRYYSVHYVSIPNGASLIHREDAYVFNNKGNVTGAYQTSNKKWACFFYNDFLILDLTPSGCTSLHPNAIHDDNTIVGHAFIEQTICSFMYRDGEFSVFSPESLSRSRAVDLNESKQILVQVEGHQAFVYEHGNFWALHSNDVSIQSKAINNAGSVVGGVRVSKGASLVPFYTAGATIIPLPLPEFSESKRQGGTATANNSNNYVVGTYGNTNGVRCSFSHYHSKMQILPDLPNKQSKAVAVNDKNTIIGYAYNWRDTREPTIALIWEEEEITNLNTLIKEQGLHLNKALDINSNGDILCLGKKDDKEVLVMLQA